MAENYTITLTYVCDKCGFSGDVYVDNLFFGGMSECRRQFVQQGWGYRNGEHKCPQCREARRK